nr:MAG TPA: hypothetical protein [Caudoviricetes sp.]
MKKGFAPNLRNRLERHSVRSIAKQSKQEYSKEYISIYL